MSKEFWNERFGGEEYIYGAGPNVYLKEKLKDLPTGKMLFPAEGEGRNSVFAALKGWEAVAFDQSEAGKKKALALAGNQKVEIEYLISDAREIEFPKESFDGLTLIYAHFPEEERRKLHEKFSEFVKPGGVLILEGFSKAQDENRKEHPKSGGPRDVGMLFDLEELKTDFSDFEFREAEELTVELSEGNHHVGLGKVIRLFGFKKRL